MFKFVNKRLRNRKGFTLIELVVVVAILGILALIAIPRFGGIREDAKAEALNTTEVTIQNAAELYHIQTGYVGDMELSDLETEGLVRPGATSGYSVGTINIDGDGAATFTITVSP